MRIRNLDELLGDLRKLDELTKEIVIQSALVSGALIIQNDAIRRVPKVSGTLSRSIHNEPQGKTVRIGTNVDYALRVEMGFNGVDSLGRKYHQPAKPYLRPAFDENIGQALDEVSDALRDQLDRLV